jgi:hypothetical protein
MTFRTIVLLGAHATGHLRGGNKPNGSKFNDGSKLKVDIMIEEGELNVSNAEILSKFI